MRIALGLKPHSGWAALVVLGAGEHGLEVVERRRLELVDEDGEWARQPYHAALRAGPESARGVVERGIESARRGALRELRATVERARQARHEVAVCAVLVSRAMPDWSLEEILAVHFRMHKAEGVLYRDVLLEAAKACGLAPLAIPERSLVEHAERALATTAPDLQDALARLGKAARAPWGKDQKEAALAAMIGLMGSMP